MLFMMVKTIFKSEDYWPSYMFLNMAELHVFEYGGTTSALLRKLALTVEDFDVKTIGWD